MHQRQPDSKVAEFDGYHRWLGIPKHQQPPNHYRLLGIALFEHDPEVIDNAASSRLIALRQQQGGPHAELCARMLNHVSQARICLLKPRNRDAYDEQLRQELDCQPTPQVEPLLDVGIADIGIDVRETHKAVRRTSRNSQSPFGTIVAAILGGATAWWIFWQFNLLPQWIQNGVQHTPAKRKVAAEPSLQKVPDVVEQEFTDPKFSGSRRKPSTRTSESPDEIPVRLSENINHPTPVNLSTVTQVTDLLQAINPDVDSVVGPWTTVNGQLHSPSQPLGLLSVNARFPKEYDLHLSVKRRRGTNSFGIGLPIGPSGCVVVLDGDHGTYSGLELIDGVRCHQNSTRKNGRTLSEDVSSEVQISVRSGQVRVDLNGQPLIDWTGTAQRLSVPTEIRGVDSGRVFLYAQDSQFEISQFTLAPVGAPFVPPQVAGGVSTREVLGESQELAIDRAMRKLGQEIQKTIASDGSTSSLQSDAAVNPASGVANVPVSDDPRVAEALAELQAYQTEFKTQSGINLAKLVKSLEKIELASLRRNDTHLLQLIAQQNTALQRTGELPAIIPDESLAYHRQLTKLYNKLDVAYRRAHQDCLKYDLADAARTLENERLRFVQQHRESLSKFELVINGGNENPITDARDFGWQVFAGRWDRGTSETPPHSGQAKFYATQSPHAELFQDIDVSDYAVLIDRREIQFILKAWVRSWPQKKVDTTRLIAHFLETRKSNPLGKYDSGEVASPGNWKELSEQIALPPKTRVVRIRLQSHRNEGRSNDGYFDDVSLKIAPPARK